MQSPQTGCYVLRDENMDQITTIMKDCQLLKDCFEPSHDPTKTIVNFYHLGITVLENSFLNSYPNISQIELTNNKICQIEDGAFQGGNLSAISLQGNSLKKIGNQFQNLPNLNLLTLKQNRLKKISPIAFKGTRNIERLVIAGNRLLRASFLRESLFQNLQVLVLDFHRDFHASEWQLPPLPHLRVLKLLYHLRKDGKPGKNVIPCPRGSDYSAANTVVFSGIDGICDNFSQALPNVRLFDVIYSDFQFVNDKVLQGFVNLSILMIRSSKVTQLHEKALQQNHNLTKFRMSKNNLAVLHERTFVLNKKLITIDLSFNRLTKLHPKFFANQRNLVTLNLYHNRLTSLAQELFTPLRKLRALDLAFNRISVIQFPEMLSMNYLSLDGNQLSELNSSLTGNLPNLETFSAAYNPLESVAQDTFKYSDITTISFGCCDTKKLKHGESKRGKCYSKVTQVADGTFDLYFAEGGTRSFKKLSLLGCLNDFSKRTRMVQFTTEHLEIKWNDNFTSLTNFKINTASTNAKIEMTGNALKHILYRQLVFLEGQLLDLRENALNYVVESAFLNCSFDTIRLDGNPLTMLNISFVDKGAQRLQTLDANHMNISSIRLSAKGRRFTNPLSIYLRNNCISHLDNIFLTGFQYLGYIDLRFNSMQSTNVNSSMLNVTSIDTINFGGNLLEWLPAKFLKFRFTTYLMDGNKWDCKKCTYVTTLKQLDIMNFHCSGNESMDKEYTSCLIIDIYTPSTLSPILAITILCKLIHSCYIFTLKRKYPEFKMKKIRLWDIKARKDFQTQSTLLKNLDHVNVIKLVNFAVEVSPIQRCLIGYSFHEGLHQGLQNPCEPILSGESICNHLLKAINYLHSLKSPICHLNIRMESLSIRMDQKTHPRLKLGCFEKARVIDPIHREYFKMDLQAASEVMKQVFANTMPVEFTILSMSLERTDMSDVMFSASDALKSPAFTPISERMWMINDLNELLKSIKQAKKHPAKSLMEEDSTLMFNGVGGWNGFFNADILRDFATYKKGYSTIKYSDLLRFIRNIVAHKNESQHRATMKSTFGDEKPTLVTLYESFSKMFPFLYLHSQMLYEIINNHDRHNQWQLDIYLETFCQYQRKEKDRGESDGSLKPLKNFSSVTIRFLSIDPVDGSQTNITKRIDFDGKKHPKKEPCTKLTALDVIWEIFPDINKKWPELVRTAATRSRLNSSTKAAAYDSNTRRIIATNQHGEQIVTDDLLRYCHLHQAQKLRKETREAGSAIAATTQAASVAKTHDSSHDKEGKEMMESALASLPAILEDTTVTVSINECLVKSVHDPPNFFFLTPFSQHSHVESLIGKFRQKVKEKLQRKCGKTIHIFHDGQKLRGHEKISELNYGRWPFEVEATFEEIVEVSSDSSSAESFHLIEL